MFLPFGCSNVVFALGIFLFRLFWRKLTPNALLILVLAKLQFRHHV